MNIREWKTTNWKSIYMKIWPFFFFNKETMYWILRSQMHYILPVSLRDYVQEHFEMVESCGWFVLVGFSPHELQVQATLLLPSSLINHFSFERLQIPAPSIFFHPEDCRTRYQNLYNMTVFAYLISGWSNRWSCFLKQTRRHQKHRKPNAI